MGAEAEHAMIQAVGRERGATRRGNVRTALVLLTVALAFFAGVIAKHWLFG
jgi:hypothetical protein